ncbi:hypothetical protein MPTK1_5g03690 [Marchantia polymorpha subsp. ruderalis]|uniref:Uncharacterized protein n=2 Tax=Marchantia polymorpha TaxID=3197 RepID=A0AAF6BEM1_MARPO|nr:hypothetical protein MARPO_0133s0020 [Marchantia polymorpha]BBN10455.1 hypothetical protein Mp_5g03690 [Marchantia polymorpha subsp. ruderalis]|eukprot:PTQ29871.1 hypothetical protein MARPO_0133s0020 [Marchantia polymorpha]
MYTERGVYRTRVPPVPIPMACPALPSPSKVTDFSVPSSSIGNFRFLAEPPADRSTSAAPDGTRTHSIRGGGRSAACERGVDYHFADVVVRLFVVSRDGPGPVGPKKKSLDEEEKERKLET